MKRLYRRFVPSCSFKSNGDTSIFCSCGICGGTFNRKVMLSGKKGMSCLAAICAPNAGARPFASLFARSKIDFVANSCVNCSSDRTGKLHPCLAASGRNGSCQIVGVNARC